MISRDLFSKDNIGKALPKLQKIIIFGCLFASIFVFIYSFILMTPFSDLYQVDCPFLFHDMARFNIVLPSNLPVEAYCYSPSDPNNPIGVSLDFFTSFTRNQLQVFNHWLFNLGFFGIIASLLPLVYFSQKRKIYYKTNIIVNPLVASFELYIGIHMLVQLITNQSLVLSQGVGYQLVNAYQTYLNDKTGQASQITEYFRPTDGNVVFGIGYFVAIVVIVFAIANIALTIFKYRYQKSQPQIDLSKVEIHE